MQGDAARRKFRWTTRRWLGTHRKPAARGSYDRLARKMRSKFRPRMDQSDMVVMLAAKRKRPQVTYKEFVDRLEGLADAMSGGLRANRDLVLKVFATNRLPSTGRPAARTCRPPRQEHTEGNPGRRRADGEHHWQRRCSGR